MSTVFLGVSSSSFECDFLFSPDAELFLSTIFWAISYFVYHIFGYFLILSTVFLFFSSPNLVVIFLFSPDAEVPSFCLPYFIHPSLFFNNYSLCRGAFHVHLCDINSQKFFSFPDILNVISEKMDTEILREKCK